MIVVLIPLAVWTLVGLIALWPRDVASHVNPDVANYNVPGVSYPTGRISSIAAMSCEGMPGSTPGVESGTCANLSVEVLDGDERGTTVEVQLTDAVFASGVSIGQEVKLIRVPPMDGQPAGYQFSDFERRTPLIVITLIFVAVVIAVARWRGLASLIGLGFAAIILVSFMFPALISGSNPVLVGLVGSSAIMFVVPFAAHGFSARTMTALLGTQFGLLLSAGLGWAATRWAHLTGVTAEDDYLLAGAAPDLSLTSVVICGIIVAGLGVLNDVTITQASAVWETRRLRPRLAAPVLPRDANRPGSHRLDRLHHRVRDGRCRAAGALGHRHPQPAHLRGAAVRAVRDRTDPDDGRLHRAGAGRSPSPPRSESRSFARPVRPRGAFGGSPSRSPSRPLVETVLIRVSRRDRRRPTRPMTWTSPICEIPARIGPVVVGTDRLGTSPRFGVSGGPQCRLCRRARSSTTGQSRSLPARETLRVWANWA